MKIIVNSIKENFEIGEKNIKLIENIINKIEEKEKLNEKFEVSITISDNDYIKELNTKYRKIEKETDVLSFPLLEAYNGEIEYDILDSENGVYLLGDVIISIDKVIEQSKSYGHSIERELGFLVAHGIYHLIGFDHQDEVNENVMINKQEEILSELGLMKD